MNLKITKANIVVCLYYLSLIVLFFKFFELTLIVWGVICFLTLRTTYSKKILSLLFISLIIFIISAISSFFYDYEWYNIIRDSSYLLKPILGLILGYNIAKILGTSALRHTVNIGFAVALIHILIILFGYFVYGIKHLNDLRYIGGYFNDFEVFVLILLLFKNKLDIELSKRTYLIFLTTLIVSAFLYFSRTNMIQFVILILAMKGYLKLTPKAIKITLSSLIIVLASYALIYQSNPTRNAKGVEAFFYKVKNAPIEAFKTKINKENWKDLHDNFRSYENIKTINQMFNDDTRAILLGKGLGSTVNYGIKMYTNEDTMIQHAPALHNSYATIFLKSGLVGLILLLLFIYLMPFKDKTNDEKLILLRQLMIGSAIFMIFSNWVFMGLYLKLDNKSIFFGFLIAYYQILSNKTENT